MSGRAIWNTAGALGLAAVILGGTFVLVEYVFTMLLTDWGAAGYAVVGASIVAGFAILFVVLMRLIPWWASMGEQRFPE